MATSRPFSSTTRKSSACSWQIRRIEIARRERLTHSFFQWNASLSSVFQTEKDMAATAARAVSGMGTNLVAQAWEACASVPSPYQPTRRAPAIDLSRGSVWKLVNRRERDGHRDAI